jgi:SPOR domain
MGDKRSRSDRRFREETFSDCCDETPELPPAPLLAVDLNEHEQAYERDEHCFGTQAYDVADQPYAAEGEYQDSEVPPYASEEHYQDNEVPRARRHSLSLLMAIFGLALVGTACAIGCRDMFNGLGSPGLQPTIKAINEPNRIALAPSAPQAESSGRQIDPATTGSIDNMVSHQQQPAMTARSKAARSVSLPRASAPATSRAGQVVPNDAVPRVAVGADAPDAWQSPGQSNGADAPSNQEHLGAARVAYANEDTGAAAPVATSGYAVQVASERSESGAQAAFRALQAKYPNQLSGRQPIIRRADLGAAGIYYRTLVGPFASAEKAAKMCRELKAAGGDCTIQKRPIGQSRPRNG